VGIWGLEGAATDDSLVWLEGLDPREGTAPVDRVLRRVADAPDPRIEPARAQVALAAAELVAALHGHPNPSLPPAGRAWVEAVGGARGLRSDADLDMLVLATRALDLVVTSSQLADLWSERDGDERWRLALDDLRMRLAAAGGMPRNPFERS
jgi:hypothetical protein